MAVVASNLCVKFGKNQILDNASIRVETGQIYGLLGPSGCGKTTLISSVLGLVRPKTGTISIFGHGPDSSDIGVPGRNVGNYKQTLQSYLC